MDSERFEERGRRRHGVYGVYRVGGRHSGTAGMLIGGVIVALGLTLLLDNLGIVHFEDVWRFWPLILIVFGVSKVLEGRTPAGHVWGGIITLVGAVFLLNNLHILIFEFDIANVIWPLLIIGFGVTLLLKAVDRRRYLDGVPVTKEGDLGAWAVFGSVKRKIESQDFKGGDALAIFGEVRIDLRKAGIAAEQAVIDVSALFGGVDIRVPESWSVVIKGAGIFGAFEDKTGPPRPDPNVKTPQLVITGFAVFGAAKVDN